MKLKEFKVGDKIMKKGLYKVQVARIKKFTEKNVIVFTNKIGNSTGREYWSFDLEVIPFDKEKFCKAEELYRKRSENYNKITKEIEEVLK